METVVKNGVTEEPVIVKEPMVKVKSNKEMRKIDDKSVEQVLKALNSLQTPEEKLAAMCKKYTEIVDENRKLQTNTKQWEKKYVLTQREKEQLQLEYNRTILLKVKLESLCRELQKQNKSVKEESLLKIREEEERRKETQGKFQTTLSEITTMMQQNNDKNTKLRDDNLEITKKFKSVVEQYELREQQVEKMAKQMTLESQLNDAKLNKASLEFQAEKEKHLTEKKQLLMELTQYQARCSEMQNTEAALRCQISMYTDKYDEFQNALTKSNEVFGGFKGEMGKMSKKILKLEKETAVWKQRWEKSHAALLDMAAEKQQRDATSALQARQFIQLQRLCRTMQLERRQLIATLQENNIEQPPLPQLPPEPEIIAAPVDTVDKVDAMVAHCAQLKQSLFQFQGQLNALTNNGAAAETPAKEQPAEITPIQKNKKKGKGKKTKHVEAPKEAEEEKSFEDNPIPPTETLSIEEVPINEEELTALLNVNPEASPAIASVPKCDSPKPNLAESDLSPDVVSNETVPENLPLVTENATEIKEPLPQDVPLEVTPVTENPSPIASPVASPVASPESVPSNVPVTNGSVSSPIAAAKETTPVSSPSPKGKPNKKNSKAAKQGKVSPEIVLQPTL